MRFPARPPTPMLGRRSAPRAVLLARRSWFTAIAAGLFEALVAVLRSVDDVPRPTGSIVAGVAVRLLLFTVASWLTVRMSHGSAGSRAALAVLLGVLGLGSLLIGPVEWVVSGLHLPSAAPSTGAWLFGASRVVHIVAVVTAMTLMFTPAANTWFRRR